ncbi:MAG: hypothetical protein AAB440_01945 [Patescibacteria group bacterium]
MSDAGHGGGDGKLPFLHSIEHFVEQTNEGAGVYIPGWGLMWAFLILIFGFFALAPVQTMLNFEFLFFLAPVWLTFLIVRWAIFSFVKWRRTDWSAEHKWVLLEIRIPHDNIRTPAAMEAFFHSLHIPAGQGTWYKRHVFGRTRDWWSFEICSAEGKIRFYVWTRERIRRATESFLYAQYPNIEIIEAEDYSRLINPSHGNWSMFACEYTFTKPSPYPIKTYVQYGLDRNDLKEGHFVDPFANVLELFGALGKDEHYWFQIVCRATRHDTQQGKPDIKTQAKQLIDKLRAQSIEYGHGGHAQFPIASPGMLMQMEAIERNVGKLTYDVGIRSIYFARPDKYMGMMAGMAVQLMKVYNSEMFNGLVPAPLWSEKFNDYPWEDIGGKRQAREMHEVVEFYRRRAYFHPPYKGPWLVMSTEELATIYHIPTTHIQTPGLERIQSTSAKPPTNLPV